MEEIAVVFPTLNEEKAIKEVIESVPEEVSGLTTKIYVVDGGSTDRTVEEARKVNAEVLMQKGSGKGGAIKQAIDEIDSDIYVFLDGDGTNPPEEMASVVKPIVNDEADHVMGNRIENRLEGSFNPLNLYLNKFFNFLVNVSLSSKFTDILTGYRALRGSHAEELEIKSSGFSIETELTLKSWEKNRVKEVPTTYRPRKGESKLNVFSDGFRILLTYLQQLYRIRLRPKLPFVRNSS